MMKLHWLSLVRLQNQKLHHKEVSMENENESYKEAHGSGFISTIVFMFVAVAVMMALRYFLHY